MSRLVYILSILILFTACNSSNETATSKEKQLPKDELLHVESLESFADSLVRLDKYAPRNMEKLAYYFQKLVPNDSTLADSATVMFLNFAWGIADTVNQKLWKDTTDYMDLVYPGGNPPTEKQKAFQQSLNSNHLNLRGNGEGDVVAVVDYNWLNAIVEPKTSPAVDGYLSLLAAESTEPTLQDAALAIELKELISRIILTESLLTQQMPVSLADNNRANNKFYIDLLCLGSENTPSLEDETKMTLTPEFKQGYEYLLTIYPSSTAAQKVNEWLAVLKAKDRKKLEKMRASQY